jgi:ubiquinone/menaquinone biosynthesis C-methylase UbiE
VSATVLERVYWALERRIAPGLESSQNVYARTVTAQLTAATRWLDLGCGHQLWPHWIPVTDKVRAVPFFVGLDPDVSSLRMNRDIPHRVAGLKLPFRDATFDLVTANMVFEHLEHPEAVLQDIRRVLAPDGVCILHTVNARYWQFALARIFPQFLKNILVHVSEDRRAADVYPTFYRINTEVSVRELSKQAGFAVAHVTMLNTSSTGRIVLLGPLVVLELMWLRLTQRPAFARFRTNIIAELQAPGGRSARN